MLSKSFARVIPALRIRVSTAAISTLSNGSWIIARPGFRLSIVSQWINPLSETRSLSFFVFFFFLLLLRTVESSKIIRDCARSEETLSATEDMIESISFEEPSGLCDRETRWFPEGQAEIVSTKVDSGFTLNVTG